MDDVTISPILKIPFQKYVKRFLILLDKLHGQCQSIVTLLVSCVYIDKLYMKDQIVVNNKNIHILFFTSLLLAHKMLEDEHILNNTWAEIAGVELLDLNEFERNFCKLSEYSFIVSDNDISKYLKKKL